MKQRPVRGMRHLTIYIYFAQMGGEGGPIKIGRSIDPHLRVSQLAVALPFPLQIVAVHRGYAGYVEGRTTERHLHWEFRASHLKGEWFAATDEVMRYVRFAATERGRAIIEREIAADAHKDWGRPEQRMPPSRHPATRKSRAAK